MANAGIDSGAAEGDLGCRCREIHPGDLNTNHFRVRSRLIVTASIGLVESDETIVQIFEHVHVICVGHTEDTRAGLDRLI